MNFDTITGVRVTHKRASIDEIETLSRRVRAEHAAELVERDGVSEAFVLQTCNRAELYVVSDERASDWDVFEPYVSDLATDAVVEMDHRGSLRHLLRVAAGLESMVLGEAEILGQVRNAYQRHEERGTIGPVFETALTKAIHVGQRARTETAINDGKYSIPSAAVDLAGSARDLTDATVLLVGAGDTASGVASALAARSPERLVVANRTREHAARLAAEIEAIPTDVVGLDALATVAADVVVTATGSDGYVVEPGDLCAEGDGVIVDIAQPRDVAPGVADGERWTLHDLSALEATTDATHRQRRRAAGRVEALVDAECARLHEQYKRNRVERVVRSIHSEADSLKTQHVETVRSQLEANGGLTPEQESILESFADALVSDLLAAPTHGLKEAAVHDEWSTIRAAVQLFDPTADTASTPTEGPPRTAVDPDGVSDANRLEND